MKKINGKIIIAAILAGIILSSCSRAYEPVNVPKRKGNCNTCSRW